MLKSRTKYSIFKCDISVTSWRFWKWRDGSFSSKVKRWKAYATAAVFHWLFATELPWLFSYSWSWCVGRALPRIRRRIRRVTRCYLNIRPITIFSEQDSISLRNFWNTISYSWRFWIVDYCRTGWERLKHTESIIMK